jgi:hypothetical protein
MHLIYYIQVSSFLNDKLKTPSPQKSSSCIHNHLQMAISTSSLLRKRRPPRCCQSEAQNQFDSCCVHSRPRCVWPTNAISIMNSRSTIFELCTTFWHAERSLRHHQTPPLTGVDFDVGNMFRSLILNCTSHFIAGLVSNTAVIAHRLYPLTASDWPILASSAAFHSYLRCRLLPQKKNFVNT